jgi:DNA-binding transcriptional LysR family regulator
MNLEQLRAFLEVADTRHFTRAAERLHLAQPSLSRQISGLESQLGVELFYRARGNVSLTAAGTRLLPIAKRMLSDADIAKKEMAELAGLTRGHVRLGATPTLCTSLVADVLTEFHDRYPGIDIEILERGSRTLIETLMEGGLDIALIVTSVSSGAARAVLEHQAILDERLVVACSKDDPEFEPGVPVSLERLAEIPQIFFSKTYDLRIAVDAAFRRQGLTPLVAVEGAEMDAALRFAERGIGAVIVPALVAFEHPDLVVAPLRDGSLTRTVSLARRADMAPTHAGAALRTLITEVADRFTEEEAAAAEFVRRI